MVLDQIANSAGDFLLGLCITFIQIVAEWVSDLIILGLEKVLS